MSRLPSEWLTTARARRWPSTWLARSPVGSSEPQPENLHSHRADSAGSGTNEKAGTRRRTLVQRCRSAAAMEFGALRWNDVAAHVTRYSSPVAHTISASSGIPEAIRTEAGPRRVLPRVRPPENRRCFLLPSVRPKAQIALFEYLGLSGSVRNSNAQLPRWSRHSCLGTHKRLRAALY